MFQREETWGRMVMRPIMSALFFTLLVILSDLHADNVKVIQTKCAEKKIFCYSKLYFLSRYTLNDE